jgi:hypothetical protein
VGSGCYVEGFGKIAGNAKFSVSGKADTWDTVDAEIGRYTGHTEFQFLI